MKDFVELTCSVCGDIWEVAGYTPSCREWVCENCEAPSVERDDVFDGIAHDGEQA